MKVAMLGYDYGYAPVHASPLHGYVKGCSPLGADNTPANFNDTLKALINQGGDLAKQWLIAETARATTEAERLRAQTALANLEKGSSPIVQSNLVPMLAVGAVGIVALILLSKRRK